MYVLCVKGNISPSGRGKITPYLITDWFLRAAFVRSRKGWSCWGAPHQPSESAGAARRRQLFCRSHPTSRITTHLHTATALQPYIHRQRKEKKAAAPSPNAFISFSLSTFRTMSELHPNPISDGRERNMERARTEIATFGEFWVK